MLRIRSGVSVAVCVAAFNAACGGGGDSVGPRPAPPPPPTNRAPMVAAAIPDHTIIEGQAVNVDISGSFTDPDGDVLSYTAESSNAGVAGVSVSGTTLSVSGTASGTATATVAARDPGGLSVSQTFSVDVAAPAPTTITVTPDSATLTAIDERVQLAAEVNDQLGRPIAPTVVWSSGDISVVTVDSSGLATAVGPGEATVTATAGAVLDTTRLTVDQTVSRVRVGPAADTLEAFDDTLRLMASGEDANGYGVKDADFIWTSSAVTVLTVGGTGLVTAVGNGRATVTASSGSAEASASVTVLQRAANVDVTPKTYTLRRGETVQLVAMATDANGYTIDDPVFVWMSSDAAVATVDTVGLVHGHADGMATVTAISDEARDTAAITVVPPPPPPPGSWRGIVVAEENRCSEYDSDEYRHSASVEPQIVARMGGRIYGPYTGTYFESTSETDIEHIVAKSEAHDSGACVWTRDERRVFANDLLNLTLASPSVNRHQKGGKDAAEWLPGLNECWFAAAIVEVRVKYSLTVDEAERTVLEGVLSGCDSTEMIFTVPDAGKL